MEPGNIREHAGHINDPYNEWLSQKDPELDPDYDPDHPFRNLPDNLADFKPFEFPESGEEIEEVSESAL